jgi:hypothetical protein
VRSLTRWPRSASAPAIFTAPFEVHRNGDSGSPRVAGATSRSSSASIPGWVSVTGLCPPPGRRTRPCSSLSPASSSASPRSTVDSEMSVGRTTAAIPP